ncbi:unnamed protein product, partial [Cyprideis torosa]
GGSLTEEGTGEGGSLTEEGTGESSRLLCWHWLREIRFSFFLGTLPKGEGPLEATSLEGPKLGPTTPTDEAPTGGSQVIFRDVEDLRQQSPTADEIGFASGRTRSNRSYRV